VEVRAAARNPEAVLLRKGKRQGRERAPLPRTPGYDLAGTLLDPAPGFSVGDEVFGMIQDHRGGASAEVASLPFGQFAHKPASLTMAEAASLPLAGMTALQALRDDLRAPPGQTVMINGASGGVGTLAVQIAKALGLTVVAVCSGRNADLVTRLGADEVIDYQTSSPAELRGLDAVFDVYGSLPWATARACLKPGGRFCTAIPRPGAALRGVLARAGMHRAALVVVRSRQRDLEELSRMVAAGQLSPVLEATLPLEDAAEAHRMIETRRTRGKIVLEMNAAT